jgi:hypothetical protein
MSRQYLTSSLWWFFGSATQAFITAAMYSDLDVGKQQFATGVIFTLYISGLIIVLFLTKGQK